MSDRLVIHPLNRGSRPMKIALRLEYGKVTGAEVGTPFYWDLGKVLRGKAPMDVLQLSQRTSGIDFIAHAIASARVLEEIAQLKLSNSAQLSRCILLGLDILYGHITHFYQTVLPDFIPFPGNTLSKLAGDFRLPLQSMKAMLENGWRAFEIRSLIHQAMAIMGGKAPHVCNIVYGGVTKIISGSEIVRLISILKEIRAFIQDKYTYDVYKIKQSYGEYYYFGKGPGRILSVGEFPVKSNSGFLIRPKVAGNFHSTNFKKNAISIESNGSWFEPQLGNGSESPLSTSFKAVPGKSGGYSWVNGALYQKQTYEVGAVARMVLSENEVITGFGENAISVMGRYRARLEESTILIEQLMTWLNSLDPKETPVQSAEVPEEGEAVCFAESAGGAIVHYASLEDGRIKNYNVLDSFSWNLCPTSLQGQLGPVEQALIGMEIPEKGLPIGVYRVARSF